MANCNCIDFPISCAPHAPGGDCCHPHGCPPHPCPPPPFKGGTSMYIGARYVPIFADPVEWDDEREYEPLTIVVHDGNCYTSKCYVPKGAQLPPYPEGQTKYWVKTSDYNYQFADLKKTVTDLSRLVEQFQKDNERFTELINGWNEKVIQWEKEMTAWGERLDTVESNVADLTASLNAEIARAKAAEQANAAAIAQETADRKQAISDLDAAYKAADAAEAQARAEADTALGNRITANKTDIDAIKAEQVIQNTNISANAKNIQDNAAEIAKHAKRLTDLESNASDWDDVFPDTTIAQEVQKEEAARANGDTALNGRCDAIAADVEEVRDIANHKVDTTTYTAGQAAQDAKITANAAALAGKADKSEIPDVSGFVTTETYTQGQAAQDYKTKIPETGVRMQTAGVYWNTDGALEMTMPSWVIPSNWDIWWTSQDNLKSSVPTSGTIELFNPKTGAVENVDYSAIRAQFDAINGSIRFRLFCDTSNLAKAVLVTGIKTVAGNVATYYPYNILTYA